MEVWSMNVLMVGHFIDISIFFNKLFINIFYQEFESKPNVLDIFFKPRIYTRKSWMYIQKCFTVIAYSVFFVHKCYWIGLYSAPQTCWQFYSSLSNCYKFLSYINISPANDKWIYRSFICQLVRAYFIEFIHQLYQKLSLDFPAKLNFVGQKVHEIMGPNTWVMIVSKWYLYR